MREIPWLVIALALRSPPSRLRACRRRLDRVACRGRRASVDRDRPWAVMVAVGLWAALKGVALWIWPTIIRGRVMLIGGTLGCTCRCLIWSRRSLHRWWPSSAFW